MLNECICYLWVFDGWGCVIGCLSAVCCCVISCSDCQGFKAPCFFLKLIAPDSNGAVIGHLIRGQHEHIQTFPFLISPLNLFSFPFLSVPLLSPPLFSLSCKGWAKGKGLLCNIKLHPRNICRHTQACTVGAVIPVSAKALLDHNHSKGKIERTRSALIHSLIPPPVFITRT